MSSESAFAAKAALRTAASRRRAAAHADGAERAAGLLATHGLARLGGLAPTTISLYWPMRTEIDPRPLALALAGAQGRLCLPVVVGRAALEFRLWQPGDVLAGGPLGTSEPPACSPVVEPDLLIVPLLAFDRRRHRLGYGAGFYDATLARLRAGRSIVAVGVGFAAQEVDLVPTDPWDEPLDLVLTELEAV